MDDEELDQMFAEKDEKICEQLNEILAKTKQRERGVNFVTDRMYKEIESLGSFLNIMVGNKKQANSDDENETT